VLTICKKQRKLLRSTTTSTDLTLHFPSSTPIKKKKKKLSEPNSLRYNKEFSRIRFSFQEPRVQKNTSTTPEKNVTE
jgi:hypothetical protein